LILESGENRIGSGDRDTWAGLSLKCGKFDRGSAESVSPTQSQTYLDVLDDKIIYDDRETISSNPKPFVCQIELEANARRPRGVGIGQRQNLEHWISPRPSERNSMTVGPPDLVLKTLDTSPAAHDEGIIGSYHRNDIDPLSFEFIVLLEIWG
jgi:hypothetical protein